MPTTTAHEHAWVVDTTADHPNDAEGYVYCEECLAPKRAPENEETATAAPTTTKDK